MTTRDLFFVLSGVLVTLVALFVARPLLAPAVGSVTQFRPRRFLAGIVCALLLISASLGLYAWRGTPEALTLPDAAAGVPPPHPTSGPKGAPGSMEEATARLAARLARDGGSAADWKLLAQS